MSGELKPYSVLVNGTETTLMLNDDDAKKRGLTAALVKDGGTVKSDGPKPLEKQNVAELEAFAASNNIDLSTASNKEQKLAICVAASADPTTLDDMTVAQLEAFAAGKKIDLGGASSKDEKLAVIKAVALGQTA